MFTSTFSFNVFCMSMPVNRLYLDCSCLSSFTWFLKLKPKCSVKTLTVDFLKISILLHLLTLLYLVNVDASLRYSIGRRPHSFCDHVHLVFISNSTRLWIKINKGKYICLGSATDFIVSNQILSPERRLLLPATRGRQKYFGFIFRELSFITALKRIYKSWTKTTLGSVIDRVVVMRVGVLVNVASLCYFVLIFQGTVSHIYTQRQYGRQQELSNRINLTSCHCIKMATTNLRRFVTYTKVVLICLNILS